MTWKRLCTRCNKVKHPRYFGKASPDFPTRDGRKLCCRRCLRSWPWRLVRTENGKVEFVRKDTTMEKLIKLFTRWRYAGETQDNLDQRAARIVWDLEQSMQAVRRDRWILAAMFLVPAAVYLATKMVAV